LEIGAENANSETTQSMDSSSAEDNREDKIKVDLLARKEIMERARQELPYTFQGKNV
jgi:hypothetical protein